MKPGLTSIGQVKFGYAATTEENIARVNYDLLYLNKNSLTLDIWIILKTAKIMLQAKGR
jgi:putative colanic acid biosynthesis UDP-glucose lipid carrier transferase